MDKHSASNASAPYKAAVGQGTIISHHQHLDLYLTRNCFQDMLNATSSKMVGVK